MTTNTFATRYRETIVDGLRTLAIFVGGWLLLYLIFGLLAGLGLYASMLALTNAPINQLEFVAIIGLLSGWLPAAVLTAFLSGYTGDQR